MSEYTLRPEEETASQVLEGIKGVWEGEGATGALGMGLGGSELMNIVVEHLYGLTRQQAEHVARFVERSTDLTHQQLAEKIRECAAAGELDQIDQELAQQERFQTGAE